MTKLAKIKTMFCFICLHLLQAGSTQSFLDEIKAVSSNYSATNSFVIEWRSYLLNSATESENYILKRCDDYYYLEGNGQIQCINGTKQVGISLNDRSIVYLEGIHQSKKVNPIQLISSLLTASSEPKLIDRMGGVKHYSFYQSNQLEYKIEVWIDVNNTRILKVIQHADEEFGGGFVFEFIRFDPICDMGPEMRIQYYVTYDSNNKLEPTTKYKHYELFTSDHF